MCLYPACRNYTYKHSSAFVFQCFHYIEFFLRFQVIAQSTILMETEFNKTTEQIASSLEQIHVRACIIHMRPTSVSCTCSFLSFFLHNPVILSQFITKQDVRENRPFLQITGKEKKTSNNNTYTYPQVHYM